MIGSTPIALLAGTRLAMIAIAVVAKLPTLVAEHHDTIRTGAVIGLL